MSDLILLRDRVDYTVQNLLISKYEHMLQHILKYHALCMRDDVFAVLALVYDSVCEEHYLANIKKFVAYAKLVAPQVLEIYHIQNYIETMRGLYGSEYYLHFSLRDLQNRKFALENECDEYA